MSEFKLISIGLKYESQIRDSLIENNPDKYNSFSIILSKFDSVSLGKIAEKNMQMPFQQKIDGINYSVFYLPNCFKILIKVDQRKNSAELSFVELKNDNRIFIIKLKKYEETPEFKLMIKMVSNSEF